MPRPLDKPTIDSVVHSSTLLNSISDEERSQLAGASHLAFADRGEIIWFNGAETSFIGLVGSGFVKMVRSSPQGHDLTAEIMGPGQIFGLMGAIEGAGCPLSARAVTQTWYLKLPKAEMLRIYSGSPRLKERLLLRTTTRLRQAYEMMARMASGKVEQRLAAILLVLKEGYSEPVGQGFRLTVPLTRQDLAELAGTTVETTIRVLSRWQKEGILDSQDRTLTILNEASLADFLKS